MPYLKWKTKQNKSKNGKPSFVRQHVKPYIPKSLQPASVNLWRAILKIKDKLRFRNWPILKDLTEIKTRLDEIQYEVEIGGYRRHQDLMSILNKIHPISEEPRVIMKTDYPIALDSNDHLYPEGTAVDNTRSPRFCRMCEQYFGRKISYLDIGCAGGGLVLDFLLRGHFALGIEGSDYSLKSQRAEWRLIPHHLFTADITKPFEIADIDAEQTRKFDLISAWEVLEHIKEEDLTQLFENIVKHLSDDGLFIGSIGTEPSFHQATGTPLHMTVQDADWWMAKMESLGFETVPSHPFDFEDFCRGVGNGLCDPDYRETPIGFHFIVRKKAR